MLTQRLAKTLEPTAAENTPPAGLDEGLSPAAQPPVAPQPAVEAPDAQPSQPARRRPVGSVSEDLAHGQAVIVTARWILVVSGLVLSLWLPGTLSELRMELAVLLVLAVANFYLQAQLLMRRPAVDAVAYLASAADITFITVLVAAQGGFQSSIFIFYYPAVLALSIAFSTPMTTLYAGSALTLYWLVGVWGIRSEGDAQTLTVRLLMIAAVAVCGNVYWRIEGNRRREAAAQAARLAERRLDRTAELRTPAQEAAEDLFFGQVVLIWARWFVILCGATLVIWASQTTSELATTILPFVVLIGLNFFLHGRYLMEQPANRLLIYATSAIDVVIITAIVLIWHGQLGLNSPLFVLYFPVLLAFALVFRPRATAVYALLTLAAYIAACAVSGTLYYETEAKILVMRLITLGAMGGLGTYYWRIQRARRRAATVAGRGSGAA